MRDYELTAECMEVFEELTRLEKEGTQNVLKVLQGFTVKEIKAITNAINTIVPICAELNGAPDIKGLRLN